MIPSHTYQMWGSGELYEPLREKKRAGAPREEAPGSK
jgi:hypothetical protein